MKNVLLVCMFSLCLPLTPDNSVMVRAGTVTKIKKLKTWFDKFEWCCIKKGCPFSKEKYEHIICLLVRNGNKIDCECVH